MKDIWALRTLTAVFLIGGIALLHASYLTITHGAVLGQNTIQILPYTPPVTATPVPTSKATPTPTGSVDFTAASLDWDDVRICGMESCPTVSSQCKVEIEQAIITEIGDVAHNIYPHGFAPESRAYLCNGNVPCRTQGYSAYNGSVPLPTFVPSTRCQAEFSACTQRPEFQYCPLLPEVRDLNCDDSDGVCTTNPIEIGWYWH